VSSLAQEDPKGAVRLVQLLPAIMRDMNNHRPDNFVYTDDKLPKYLQQAAVQLVKTRGEGLHGKNWVLDQQGKLQCL
jgi:hypothetical protein